jgi:IcmF-related N-terminal domain
MLKILQSPWVLLKRLFVLAFPMVRGESGGSAGVWVARVVLVSVVLVVLALVNEILGIKGWISYGRIGRYWLPLLAFCLYAMIWLGWWLYGLLNLDVPQRTSEFPDIDHAWRQATEALARSGIELENTPLFLVLGGCSSGEEALFQSAAIRATVKHVPKEPAAPLHVTANNDGIWVTCMGASVLGQQLLGMGEGAMNGAGEVSLETLSRGESPDPFKTVALGGGETLRIEDFLATYKESPGRPPVARRSRPTVDVETYSARLRYLCQLIARDRMGLCPVNGVLIVLPITAADDRNMASEVALASKTDLAQALDLLRLRCPVLSLVSDLDKLPGFVELVERLPSDQRAKRMGQRFPLVPELDSEDVPGSIKDSVSWVGSNLFLSMVYSLFAVETPGGEELTEVTRANSQLFRFLAAMRERRERLSQFVRDCLPVLPDEPILFRGCYFAGTGVDPSTGQAFCPGVFRLLISEQNRVTWTSAALQQDADSLRLARWLRIFLIGCIAAGTLAILARLGWKFFASGGDDLPG